VSLASAFLDESRRLRPSWRFGVSLIVVAAAAVLGAAAASFVPASRPILSEAVYRFVELAVLLRGFAFLLRVADGVPIHPLAAMGIGVHKRMLRQQFSGIALGGGMVLVCVAVIAVAGRLSFQINLTAHTAERALLALAILGTAAMSEEVTFRGYPFQRLVESAGATGAILITSIFFGLVHSANPHVSRWGVVNTIFFGILLALAYLRTRSLWLPWGIHFGWNTLLALGFGLPLSGFKLFAIVVKGVASGPEWMTGGAYGIEGGALATIVITIGIGAVLWITKFPAMRTEPLDLGTIAPVEETLSPASDAGI
jgi:uncharacterized protein